MPTLEQFIEGTLPPEMITLFVLMLLWSLAWKGVALWKSARLHHKWWFVALLLVNSIGLLEIIYIFLIARREEERERMEIE